MKFRDGFTLVETMIVLAISTLILSLSLFAADNFNFDRVRCYFFWKEFQSQFELSENLARQRKMPTVIKFWPHQKVEFDSRYFERQNSGPLIIKLPNGLSPVRPCRVEIYKTGHVSPQRLDWSRSGQPDLVQTFQLSWGVYNLKTKK